jgi:DNA-binding NarL/FixJ family response regulator
MIAGTPPPPTPAARQPGDVVAPVRVLVADHDGLARRMIREAVDDAVGLVAVATARDTRETLELARFYRPDVLIVDTALPPLDCAELVGELVSAVPDTRILTVSAADDDETVLAALRRGAVGHANKDIDPRELAHEILHVADGQAVIPPRLAMPVLELLREVPDAGWRPLRSRLTTREWEIVEMLADDASTERIADCLVLSATTVYSHVKSVLRKLDVHSRHDAVAAAERLRREEAMGTNPPTPFS